MEDWESSSDRADWIAVRLSGSSWETELKSALYSPSFNGEIAADAAGKPLDDILQLEKRQAQKLVEARASSPVRSYRYFFEALYFLMQCTTDME